MGVKLVQTNVKVLVHSIGKVVNNKSLEQILLHHHHLSSYKKTSILELATSDTTYLPSCPNLQIIRFGFVLHVKINTTFYGSWSHREPFGGQGSSHILALNLSWMRCTKEFSTNCLIVKMFLKHKKISLCRAIPRISTSRSQPIVIIIKQCIHTPQATLDWRIHLCCQKHRILHKLWMGYWKVAWRVKIYPTKASWASGTDRQAFQDHFFMPQDEVVNR